MRDTRRGFTLIETAVALWIVGLAVAIVFAWAAIGARTAGTGMRTAVRSADGERLLGLLQEDLAQASRLVPAGNGFDLDLPGDGERPDTVRYRKEGAALLRDFLPAKGSRAAHVSRRVASWVGSCAGESPDAHTFRVTVKWEAGKGEDLVIDFARRVEAKE